jgi:hypothetical protein
LIRSRRRIFSFAALALTLLLAQIGAVAHGYSHLRLKQDLTGTGTTSGQVCTECLSFTPLLSAAGTPNSIVVFHPPCVHEAPYTAVVSPSEGRTTYAFRSRAPPSLV